MGNADQIADILSGNQPFYRYQRFFWLHFCFGASASQVKMEWQLPKLPLPITLF